jgi:HTH-type transcriptional regulator/antitoxin HigA
MMSTTASRFRPRPQPQEIQTAAEHEEALAYIDTLMSAEEGTPEMGELERWVQLVVAYEEGKYPIEPPAPAEAMLFRKEQQGPTA